MLALNVGRNLLKYVNIFDSGISNYVIHNRY